MKKQKDLATRIEEGDKQREVLKRVDELAEQWKDLGAEEQKKRLDPLLYCDIPILPSKDRRLCINKLAERGIISKKDAKAEIQKGVEALGTDEDEEQEESPLFKKSQADFLVELLKEVSESGDITYFFDEYKELCSRIKVKQHYENYRVKSHSFRHFARRIFYEASGKAISNDALGTALDNLEAILPDDSEQHTLSLRVAQKDGAIYYDLVNRDWETVRITTQGWEVIDNPPVHFRRFSHQRPQVTPERNGDAKEFLEFLNLKDEDSKILTLTLLHSLFIPDIPHPIAVLFGAQGSGKSFLFKMMREIIDPSLTSILSLSRDRIELIQQLSHHYFNPYDNLTSLPVWANDTLCRAVTGEGNTKRRLYTDDEDVVYSYRRCIGLNGINCVALKPDVLDRCILIELQRIPRGRRKEEKELWDEFNKVKGRILGGVFDVLSKALAIYPCNLADLPRMADFARWGYAIAEALDMGGERFLQAYYSNIQTQNVQVIEGNSIATCLSRFIQERREWTGTASELLAELEKVAEESRINTKAKGWVNTPQHLTRKLNTFKVNLEEVGITYTNEHKETGSNIYLFYQKERDSIVSSVRPSETDAANPDGNLTVTDDKEVVASAIKSAIGKQPDAADDNFPIKSNGSNGMQEDANCIEV